jgi:exopolysaccharide/PEP-CTERM locus tyrosine autokinase
MGKISEALKKAGYQEGVLSNEEKTVRKASEVIHADVSSSGAQFAEKSEPSQLTSGGKLSELTEKSEYLQSASDIKIDNKVVSSQVTGRRWNERFFNAVNENVFIPEVFKVLRSQILNPKKGEAVPRTIMITSATAKEGKSFVAANLGVSFACGVDQYSLLVDCDLRRPTIASLFGMARDAGLADYLQDQVDMSEVIKRTEMKKLSVLPSGGQVVNPAELLGSLRMQALVKELSIRFEDRTIIFDTPPVLVAAETSVLARLVDGVILVVRQGVAKKNEVEKAVNMIGAKRIIGVVFNDRVMNYFEKSRVTGYGDYY